MDENPKTKFSLCPWQVLAWNKIQNPTLSIEWQSKMKNKKKTICPQQK
jgi:hypothetical protein